MKALSSPPSREIVFENSPTAILSVDFEHQMLEKVGDARHALGLVGGADLVPDHVGHDRGPVVGDDDHVHAIGEGELGRAGLCAGIGNGKCGCEHRDCHR